ncbi:hypothetical protein V8E54_011886 [Elaphomyces granulatus]
MIPSSLRRRISQLQPFQKPFIASARLQSRASGSASDCCRGIACSSEPQLEYYGTKPNPCVSMTGDQESTAALFSVSVSESEGPLAPTRFEGDSGLKWNRIIPAANLLRNAGYEAQQTHTDSRLVRSLYINALLYLLDALPEDLTSDEAHSLQSRLPEPIKVAISALPAFTDEQGPVDGKQSRFVRARCPRQPSYLHRILSTTIVCCFLIIQFLIPYAKLVVRNLYQYERSHRITERVIAALLKTADSLGKGSANFGSTMMGFGKGRVGAAASSFAAWWIESVASGIYDGVGEGMVMLGVIHPNVELWRDWF